MSPMRPLRESKRNFFFSMCLLVTTLRSPSLLNLWGGRIGEVLALAPPPRGWDNSNRDGEIYADFEREAGSGDRRESRHWSGGGAGARGGWGGCRRKFSFTRRRCGKSLRRNQDTRPADTRHSG